MSARWSIGINLHGDVELLPNAEAAIARIAAHDDQADNIPRWCQRARRMLIIKYGDVVSEDASDAELLTALFRREIIGGTWQH